MSKRERRAWNIAVIVAWMLLLAVMIFNVARAQSTPTVTPPDTSYPVDVYPIDMFDPDPMANQVISATRLVKRECSDYDRRTYANANAIGGGLTRLTCSTVYEPFANWLDRYDPWIRTYESVDWIGTWETHRINDEGSVYFGGFTITEGGYMYIISVYQADNSPNVGSVIISKFDDGE